MEDFLAFIVFVFGVLNIILFFKIWGMTNNVSAMRKKISSADKVQDIVRIEKMKGTSDSELQKILAEKMACDLLKIYNDGYSISDKYKEWEEHFICAGIEIPKSLKRMTENDKLDKLYDVSVLLNE